MYFQPVDCSSEEGEGDASSTKSCGEGAGVSVSLRQINASILSRVCVHVDAKSLTQAPFDV